MIHPQNITGKYRNIKNVLIVFLLLLYVCSSWIRFDRGAFLPNQAILIDLPNRMAYFFWIQIWPDEVYYLTGILIMAALGLFFFTSLFGRLWCGYTCPHTVFTDIFVKIEAFFQGDRNQRIKLDASPMTWDKFKKKLYTHLAWIFMGFVFAVGWVSYFTDSLQLLKNIPTLSFSPSAGLWIFGLTFSTYLFAGYIRQKVCVYMCPYGRFQSAMIDKDTSFVMYNNWRGEPRGKVDNAGDCIDCNKCVVVCPMGIDIRDGLQMSCIGCGLCVDACDSVMQKLSKPLGLISYDSINSSDAKKEGRSFTSNIIKLKNVIFFCVFCVVLSLILYGLSHKDPITTSVIRSRGPLYTIMPDGSIRNPYTLKIINRSMHEMELDISVIGINDAKFKVQGSEEVITKYQVKIKPFEEFEKIFFVQVPNFTFTKNGNYAIQFVIADQSTKATYNIESAFMAPDFNKSEN